MFLAGIQKIIIIEEIMKEYSLYIMASKRNGTLWMPAKSTLA